MFIEELVVRYPLTRNQPFMITRLRAKTHSLSTQQADCLYY